MFCSLPHRVRRRARLEPARRLLTFHRDPHRYGPRGRRQHLQYEILRAKARSEQHAPSAGSSITSDDGWRYSLCRRPIHIRMDVKQACALDRVCHHTKLCHSPKLMVFQTLHWRCAAWCWLLDDIPSLAELYNRYLSALCG